MGPSMRKSKLSMRRSKQHGLRSRLRSRLSGLKGKLKGLSFQRRRLRREGPGRHKNGIQRATFHLHRQPCLQNPFSPASKSWKCMDLDVLQKKKVDRKLELELARATAHGLAAARARNQVRQQTAPLDKMD